MAPYADVKFNTLSPLSAANYSCNHGYYMASGQATHYCQRDQQWSGALPNCTGTVNLDPFSAGTVFGRQNLTSVDVRL